MDVEKLEKLAVLLEGFPEGGEVDGYKFNLKHWRCENHPSCGTAACAVGHAMIAGITEDLKHADFTANTWGLAQASGNLVSFHAVAKEFGIPFKEAVNLFHNSSYNNPHSVTPRQVAERIRSLIGLPDMEKSATGVEEDILLPPLTTAVREYA